MIVVIAVAVLVLGIAFFQVVQGTFSALVMAFLSILCALLALNYFEPLSAALLLERMPGYAHGASLLALFVLPLLALRYLFDTFIPGNAVMGVWIDRIGGGVLGIVTGLVCVGVLMLVLQMLPLGASVLGYRPYDASLGRQQSLAPFQPDRFVTGLAEVTSAGSLSGSGGRFGLRHDDLPLELFCARNEAGIGARTDCLPDALRVEGAYDVTTDNPAWVSELPTYPLRQGAAPGKVIVLRVSVSETARQGEEQPGANWWLLPATHFRLVCEDGRSVYPIGYLTGRARLASQPPGTATPAAWKLHAPEVVESKLQMTALAVARPYANEKEIAVDWVFEVPTEAKPAYVVFRRVSAGTISDVQIGPLPSALQADALVRIETPPRR